METPKADETALTNQDSFVATIVYSDKPCNKTFPKDESQNNQKIQSGLAQTHKFSSIHELVSFFDSQELWASRCCIMPGLNIHEGVSSVYGIYADGMNEYGKHEFRLHGNEPVQGYLRQAHNYSFDYDTLGIHLTDVDFKDGQLPYMAPMDLIAMQKEIMPVLDACDMVVKHSSSNVYPIGEKPKSANYHIYAAMPLKYVQRVNKYLHMKLFIMGHGYIFVNSAGSPDARSYIDTAVHNATSRIIYTARPSYDESKYDYNHCTYAVPKTESLTFDELCIEFSKCNPDDQELKAEYDTKVRELINTPEIQEKVKVKTSEHNAKRTEKYRSKGYSSEKIKSMLDKEKAGVLELDHELWFHQHGWMTIREAISRQITGYCADPLEWDDPENSGTQRAVFRWNDYKGYWEVLGFIHGNDGTRIFTVESEDVMAQSMELLSELETRNEPATLPDEVDDTPQSNRVDISKITKTAKVKRNRKEKNFWKGLNIKLADIEKKRDSPYDFFIDISQMPDYEFYRIWINGVRGCEKAFLKNQYDPTLTFNQAMRMYKDGYHERWNPETQLPRPYNFMNKHLEKERLRQFKVETGRRREKLFIDVANGNVASVTNDAVFDNFIHEYEALTITGEKRSIGYNLMLSLLQYYKSTRKRKLEPDDEFKMVYAIMRFVAMAFTYPTFIFPLSKDSLELRSRKKKQKVDPHSIYFENWPMHKDFKNIVEHLESIDQLETEEIGKKTVIKLKNHLLELCFFYRGTTDLRMQKEVVRLVDETELTFSNPRLKEYMDNDFTNELREAIHNVNEKVNLHQIVNLNDVVSDLYVQVFDIDSPDPEVHPFNLPPKDNYHHNGKMLSFKRMCFQDALDASQKIFNVAAKKVDMKRNYRMQKAKSNNIKMPSYAQDGIPALIVRVQGGVGLMSNEEGFQILDDIHPSQIGDLDWFHAQ